MTTDPTTEAVGLESLDRYCQLLENHTEQGPTTVEGTDYATADDLRRATQTPDSRLKRTTYAIATTVLLFGQTGVAAEPSQPIPINISDIANKRLSSAERYRRATFGQCGKLVWNTTRYEVRQLIEDSDD